LTAIFLNQASPCQRRPPPLFRAPPAPFNFLPGRGAEVGKTLLVPPDLAGVHFTGSTGTFQAVWRTIGSHIENYRGYPRVVGETGGRLSLALCCI
jgi:acyl-CoA reductase-like NAD-dependent aldehyde dehydrogenase